MADLSRFSYSAASVSSLAIFILPIGGSTHTGIVHRTDGILHSLDLMWNDEVGSGKLEEDCPCVTPVLEAEETINLLSLCRLIHLRMEDADPKRHLRIPYAIRYGGSRFDQKTAEFDLGEGYGLTCSTFVLCVFDSNFVPLIELKDWKKRDDDQARINKYLTWLERGFGGFPPASKEHIERFKVDIQRKDCLRVRPEEVAAAGLFDNAVGFPHAVPAGKWILSRLYPTIESNDSLGLVAGSHTFDDPHNFQFESERPMKPRNLTLHSIHEHYLISGATNTVGCLISLLDQIPGSERDNAIMSAAMTILQTSIVRPVSHHQTLNDLITGHVSYSQFTNRLLELVVSAPEGIIVAGVVHDILAYLCGRAFADIDETIRNNQSVIERCQKTLETEILPAWQDSQTRALLQKTLTHIEELPAAFETSRQFYVTFCEVVLAGLLDENRRGREDMIEQLRGSLEQLSDEEFPGAPKE